jgi:hypothetical protein
MRFRLPIVLALVAVGLFSFLAQKTGQAQSSVSVKAHCLVRVPPDWGEFVGASTYGLGFRDNQGTIRFVAQMPCNLDGPPNISLQIKRQ